MSLERRCIKCGGVITHHHKYCDKCYPAKTATIQHLSFKVKGYSRAIEALLNYASNPKKYITKRELIAVLKKNKIKEHQLKVMNNESINSM